MKRLTMSVVAVLALVAASLPLMAQTAAPAARPSPHDVVNARMGTGRGGPLVVVYYGRPHATPANGGAKRKVWGTLVPYGQVWRAGADEATILTTQVPLVFGSLEVPAGAYTLAMQPEADGTAKLIINKQIGQWGIPYNGQATELGRVEMKKEAVPTEVEQFTIAFENKGADGQIMKFIWENTQYTVAFNAKK